MNKTSVRSSKPLLQAYGDFSQGDFDKAFKTLIESYRCRVCKIPLTLDNFGRLGPNHFICCKNCV